MKTCSKCGVEKGLTEFAKSHGQCKKCRCAYSALWAKLNPKKVKASNAARVKENPEIAKARYAQWYKENSEHVKARSYSWDKANPEKKNASKAKYQYSERGVALKISRSIGIQVDQIPEEFIKVKHAHLTLLREIRKAKKNENTKRREAGHE